MLLETLDIKKNDIIIYSQNIFNLDNNFKIIFKDDEEKLSRKISYKDVCKFVNEFTPKNLIVYRLLTNLQNFKIDPSQYGFILSINDRMELIYFDPVFAVNELERYSRLTNLNDLRFRIQQVGLTMLNRKGNLPNYTEIYAIDLEAMEAKFQNDKAFADAIMAADPGKAVKSYGKGDEKSVSKVNATSFAERIIQSQKEIIHEKKESIDEMHHEISEDKDFDYNQIMKMNLKGNFASKESTEVKESKTEEGPSLFSEFLRKKLAGEKSQKVPDDSKDFTDIFKSSVTLKDYISSKEDKKIVLRLDKKQST